METDANERGVAPLSPPWFERVGPSGFAAGGAALGFAMSLLFVLNSAPGASNTPTPLLSAEPQRRSEIQGIKQSAQGPAAPSSDSIQVELMSQPLMSPLKRAIKQDHSTHAPRTNTISNTDRQSEKVANHVLPIVAATADYLGTPVTRRDSATSTVNTGTGTGRVAPNPSISFDIPVPRTEYRSSAPTKYRSSARKKYRTVDQRSSDREATVPTSEAAFGTTAAGNPTFVGPRGGIYHYSASGNKVYQRKR
jgi:hypothetical protein